MNTAVRQQSRSTGGAIHATTHFSPPAYPAGCLATVSRGDPSLHERIELGLLQPAVTNKQDPRNTNHSELSGLPCLELLSKLSNDLRNVLTASDSLEEQNVRKRIEEYHKQRRRYVVCRGQKPDDIRTLQQTPTTSGPNRATNKTKQTKATNEGEPFTLYTHNRAKQLALSATVRFQIEQSTSPHNHHPPSQSHAQSQANHDVTNYGHLEPSQSFTIGVPPPTSCSRPGP